MQAEIIQSKEILEKKLNKTIPIFCYPNGDNCIKARDLVQSYYQAALLTEKGWNNKNSDPYMIKRIALHQDVSATKSAFISRISGWL